MSSRRAMTLGVPSIVLSGVAAGVLFATVAQNGSATGRVLPAPGVVSRFGIFARPPAAGTLPVDAGPQAAAAPLARAIATGDPEIAQWATLNGKQACVVVDGSAPGAEGGPTACGDIEAATNASELLTIAASATDEPNQRPGQAQIIAGLAPDGVDTVTITLANATEHTVAVVDNGFHLITGGNDPVSLEWTDASGAKHIQRLKGG
jgi:hypothetical protein